MKTCKVSFGEIIILESNLAEVIINEGVDMNLTKVIEYRDVLKRHFEVPFALLVNKKNSYSYDFDAQRVLGELIIVEKMAVLINNVGGLMSTETLMDLNGCSTSKIKTFRFRETALDWLLEDEN